MYSICSLHWFLELYFFFFPIALCLWLSEQGAGESRALALCPLAVGLSLVLWAIFWSCVQVTALQRCARAAPGFGARGYVTVPFLPWHSFGCYGAVE